MDYLKRLNETILPHWIAITPDTECGGTFTKFDANENPIFDKKDIWFLGRAMWSYAMAYRHCEPKQEYLDICAQIFPFIKKVTFENGKLPWFVTREGEPLAIRQRTYYTEMFAAMGCAQYYRISGREDVKAQTQLYMDYIHACYLAQQTTSQEEEPDRMSKCFGLHMAILAAVQFVRNAGICVQMCDEIAALSIGNMKNGGFVDYEKRKICEHVALPGEKLWDSDVGSSCPGHIYEAAWFVMCEGEVKNDDEIRQFGRLLLDCALPEGFEKYTQLVPTGNNHTKSFEENYASGVFLGWPQQEAIIAFRLGYYLFGEKKYLELSNIIEQETFDYYAKFENAEWYREIYKKDGVFTDVRGVSDHIYGPFHYERYLLALGILEKTGSILPYMA